MNIDLDQIIDYSDDFSKPRHLIRAYLKDMYPNAEIRVINILLNVYESGIAKQLYPLEKITSMQYKAYIGKLENDYGMTSESAIEALNAWIDVCIKKGAGTRYGNSIIKAKQPLQVIAPASDNKKTTKISLGQNDTIYDDKNLSVTLLKLERTRYLNTGFVREGTFLFVNKTAKKLCIKFKNIAIEGFLNQEESISYALPGKQKGMKGFILIYEDRVPGIVDDFESLDLIVSYGKVQDGYNTILDGDPIESQTISLALK